MLECLDTSPSPVPLGEGVQTGHVASSSASSPREGDRGEEGSEATGVFGGEGGRDGERGHAVDDEDRKLRGSREKNRFVTHTCWVKAGHDLVYERGPFLRALLHKVGAA